MLGMTDIDLKQTRFYQNVLAEGRQAGRQEGKRADRKARPRVAKPKPHACCVACSPAALARYPTGPTNTSAKPRLNNWKPGRSAYWTPTAWKPSCADHPAHEPMPSWINGQENMENGPVKMHKPPLPPGEGWGEGHFK